MTLGLFISDTLKEKGVSLYFLHKATKISYPYLLAIEKGKRTNPSYGKLKKIAEALDVDLRELLEAGGFETKKKTPTVSKTASEKAPQRVPLIPWVWLLDTADIPDAMKTHAFRHYKYTMLKEPDLYAIDIAKPLDGFPEETTLIIQLNITPKLGQQLLIKGVDGLGIYQVSQMGDAMIAVPRNPVAVSLAISRLQGAGCFFARVREAVMRF